MTYFKIIQVEQLIVIRNGNAFCTKQKLLREVHNEMSISLSDILMTNEIKKGSSVPNFYKITTKDVIAGLHM